MHPARQVRDRLAPEPPAWVPQRGLHAAPRATWSITVWAPGVRGGTAPAMSSARRPVSRSAKAPTTGAQACEVASPMPVTPSPTTSTTVFAKPSSAPQDDR